MNFTGIEEFLVNLKLDPNDFITETKIKDVSIIPCHSELDEVAVRLLMRASFFSFKEVLKRISDFDFILIDTQPSKNILMLNCQFLLSLVVFFFQIHIYPDKKRL